MYNILNSAHHWCDEWKAINTKQSSFDEPRMKYQTLMIWYFRVLHYLNSEQSALFLISWVFGILLANSTRGKCSKFELQIGGTRGDNKEATKEPGKQNSSDKVQLPWYDAWNLQAITPVSQWPSGSVGFAVRESCCIYVHSNLVTYMNLHQFWTLHPNIMYTGLELSVRMLVSLFWPKSVNNPLPAYEHKIFVVVFLLFFCKSAPYSIWTMYCDAMSLFSLPLFFANALILGKWYFTLLVKLPELFQDRQMWEILTL